MKTLIAAAFLGAGCAAVLSHARVLPADSMLPPIIFAVALIVTLLHLINTSDRVTDLK